MINPAVLPCSKTYNVSLQSFYLFSVIKMAEVLGNVLQVVVVFICFWTSFSCSYAFGLLFFFFAPNSIYTRNLIPGGRIEVCDNYYEFCVSSPRHLSTFINLTIQQSHISGIYGTAKLFSRSLKPLQLNEGF